MPAGAGVTQLSLQVRVLGLGVDARARPPWDRAAATHRLPWQLPAEGPYLSAVPLALVRSRCCRSPWNCGSLKASRQLGVRSEASQSGLSDAAGDNL